MGRLSIKENKRVAAEKATEWVEDGMALGLGTGTTTLHAIIKIGEMVKQGYDLVGVPTSIQTGSIAESLGIPLTTLDEVERLDLTIDGADEVDPQKRLIKGRGGALLREKVVASCTEVEIIVVDDSKMVETLCTRSPLPVEVLPFGHMRTKEKIEATGCEATLRSVGSPYLTDSGNFIYDCAYGSIEEPAELERELNSFPGVVENGLFLDLADRVIIAGEGGIRIRE